MLNNTEYFTIGTLIVMTWGKQPRGTGEGTSGPKLSAPSLPDFCEISFKFEEVQGLRLKASFSCAELSDALDFLSYSSNW